MERFHTIILDLQGINKDKMGKNLKIASLDYYIKNLDKENEGYLNSLKELYRRDRTNK